MARSTLFVAGTLAACALVGPLGAAARAEPNLVRDPSCTVIPVVPAAGVAVMRLPRTFIRAGSDSVWSPPLASGPSELSVSVAVDAIGRVAIAGERSGEVFVLSPEGAPIARLTGLSSPRALAFADDGTLLVAETGAARVRRWTLEPERTD